MNQTSAPDNLLIVCLGAIGDVCRALPLAVRIKKQWPDTEVHWAVEPISMPLVTNHPAIDRVHVFDRPRGLAAYWRFVRELRSENFKLVLDLQRHFKSGVTSLATGAKRRIAFNRQNSREFNWLLASETIKAMPHFSFKISQFQEFGSELGLLPMEPLEFGLEPSREELSEVEKTISENLAESTTPNISTGTSIGTPSDQKRVALILGSTWESRVWLVERYVELIQELEQRWQIRSILIGSKSERDTAEQICQKVSGDAVINLVEKTPLGMLPAVFSSVRFAVGSDSGPMHIAAAVGIPVISLWGSTSAKRSAPYGSDHLVLKSVVGCSPCYKKNCPGLDKICMADIPVQAVLAHAETLVENDRIRRLS